MVRTLSSSTDRTTAFIYPTVASIEANNNFGRFFFTVTGTVVHEAYLEINPMSEYQNKLLFNFADITYTGTPVLSFYIDGVYASISPALSAVSSGIRTTRVWFENAVVGHVPCYYDSSTSGEIHNISFGTEDA